MTDIIERSPMHTEDQLLKVADVIMALIEPRLKERMKQMIDEHSDDIGSAWDIDEQITEWMRLNFDFSDYYEFDIHDSSWEIGQMIDDHIEEKEDDDGKFRERVTDVLKDITVGFDIK
tara:strand:- start:479 stop:832 length:354 start_codon:yes stop_codon:yes gene_type:complete